MILAHLHRFSLLFQKTADSRYQDEHVSNVLSNYNQISTARHLQVWQQFAEWCEPFGFHPANISTSFLLDFIYEATYQIKQHKFSMKSLVQSFKFVAHQAEVTKLIELLNAPVINGYVSSTKKPQNPREVFPLPFHVAIAFEEHIQDIRRPPSSRLLLGVFFMFWTGLRFQDLQRTKPSSIWLTDGILRAVCELSKSGQPQPAACIACGFTTLTCTAGWGYFWYDLLQEWISTLQEKAPSFELDFIFPEVQGEGPISPTLIPRPMVYSKAASILRHVAKQPFMSPPYTAAEVTSLTVHSAKSTLISAAKQLDYLHTGLLSKDIIEVNGLKVTDIAEMIRFINFSCRRKLSVNAKLGWRPMTPQARRGQHPVAQRPFIIPTGKLHWPIFLDMTEVSDLKPDQELTKAAITDNPDPIISPEPHHLSNQGSEVQSSVKESVDSSSSSSESSSSSSEEDTEQSAKGPFFLNHFTRVAHYIKKTREGKSLPACGAKLFDESLYRISDELPSHFDLCNHKGCRPR